MMISPNTYFELELKHKPKEEILKEIRQLKREINGLKSELEDFNYDPRTEIYPTRLTRIKTKREYLNVAIRAYEEAGGTYILTGAEQKSRDFDEMLESIKKLTFQIGGFFSGFENRIFTFDGNKVKLDVEQMLLRKMPEDMPTIYPLTKEEFVAGLRQLHIGEWKKEYEDPDTLDGISWEMEISLEGKSRPVKVVGINAYPYNFKELKDLLGVEYKG